jgi:hypothetical protein
VRSAVTSASDRLFPTNMLALVQPLAPLMDYAEQTDLSGETDANPKIGSQPVPHPDTRSLMRAIVQSDTRGVVGW